jgi:Thioredoxin
MSDSTTLKMYFKKGSHFNDKFDLQCEPMDDAMKVMAEEEPELAEVQFLRVEAEERQNISMEYQVAAVPTFLFFRNGTASRLSLAE